MNQEHPWPRIGTLLTTLTVVLITLALAGGLPAARTASAQTIPEPTAIRQNTAVPTLTVGPGTPTPLPVTPTPTGPISSGGGVCVAVITDDDGVAPGTITLIEIPVEDLANRDPRYTYIRACDVVYTDAGGVTVPSKIFTGPIELCFPLTPDDLARAGGNPERLTIVYYDEATGTWVELPVIVDQANGQICAQQSISGKVALVLKGQAAGLPGTAGEIPEGAAAGGAAPAPAAAPAGAPAAAPASAPAAAPAAAPASAPAEQALAAPVAAAAESAPAQSPAGAGPGPMLALVLGVAAAVFAVIVVLSRNMLSRSRDQ